MSKTRLPLFHAAIVSCVSCLLAIASPACAQDRQDVTFSTNQTTVPGQSIFVLGSLPELGGNDLRFSVKLEPSTYPIWKATVSLPVNTSYTYRFYRRNDAAGQWGNASNGEALGAGVISASTGTVALTPTSKTVFFHSTITPPVLYWRPSGSTGAYQSVVMHEVGPGRTPAERRWAARGFGAARQKIEFFFANQSFTQFDPADSTQLTSALDTLLVQDAGVFSYVPAAALTGPMKRYTTTGSNPTSTSTTIFSSALNETRGYRVITPRGYDEHPQRRYPVLYLHDGQNVFERGSFGDWLADSTAERLTRVGLMREAILVGLDHGNNRLNDYAAPQSGGWSNGRYLTFVAGQMKPFIDGAYRTLTGPADTAIAGSSMGGQASLWFGWDRPDMFGRLGVFSGAWTVFTTGFYDKVRAEAKRPVRIYLDSGDSGTSQDLFRSTFDLRDNFINPARASGAGGPYVLERDLRYAYGPGQSHNEAAWAARLPGCLEFLLPASEAPDELASLPSARPADVNDDATISIEDLYAWEQGTPAPASSLDVDRDGTFEPQADRAALLGALRGSEPADLAAGL